MNYFVEGLQGAGKTTFVQEFVKQLSEYKAFREGDFSPVELAWCAYVTEEQYDEILKKYPSLEREIREKTVVEEEHKIICYTQILTDISGCHKDVENFEIYNGTLDREAFEKVIFSRYQRWNGEGQIFECSIFQNIIENLILFFDMSDEEILNFYVRLKTILAGKQYEIIYLALDDIPGAIDVIRKERSDDTGNELWFPMMLQYLESSPHGKLHALTGLEGLIAHLERRKALELQILDEVFPDNSVVLKAKSDSVNSFICLHLRR